MKNLSNIVAGISILAVIGLTGVGIKNNDYKFVVYACAPALIGIKTINYLDRKYQNDQEVN